MEQALRKFRRNCSKRSSLCGNSAGIARNGASFAEIPQELLETEQALRKFRRSCSKWSKLCGNSAGVARNGASFAEIPQELLEMEQALRKFRRDKILSLVLDWVSRKTQCDTTYAFVCLNRNPARDSCKVA
jgi:ribosomal protein S21